MKRNLMIAAYFVCIGALACVNAHAQNLPGSSAPKPASNAGQNPGVNSTANPGSAAGLAGNWQGTLNVGNANLRLGMMVTKSATGEYSATLVSIDQNGSVIPVQQTTLTGNTLHLEIPAIKGSYDGVVSANGQEIAGTFTQGMPAPFTFKRVDKLDPPPGFGEKEKSDVTSLINTYFHSFTVKDWDAFHNCFQVPFLRWGGGQMNLVATADEIVTGFVTLHAQLEMTDYAVSRADQMIITPLSPISALVDVHWKRDKKDGSLFGEGAEILVVSKSSGSWKITGNIAHQLSQYGKSY